MPEDKREKMIEKLLRLVAFKMRESGILHYMYAGMMERIQEEGKIEERIRVRKWIIREEGW